MRPDAYVLGRDCRAFPPTSLAQRHAEAQRTQSVSASTGARQLAPVTDSVWPAVTSPGNRLVRGPWRTPDALNAPPYPAAYRAASNRPYQSTVPAEWRLPARYKQQTSRDAGGHPVHSAWAGARPAASDGADLNVSMNRATSDHEPVTQLVTPSSASLDVEHQLTSASAVHYQSSAPTLTIAAQHADPDQLLPTTKTTADRRPNVAIDRRSETLAATSGPLTSTPVDHVTAAGK